MNFEDFLGNIVEVGDLVIFTPQSTGGDLVLGKLLDLIPDVRYGQRYNEETGKYDRTEHPYLKPVVQPLKGVNKYRFRDWKNGEYVPKVARKVTLLDTDSVMLYQKGTDNERVDASDSVS